MYIHVHTAHPIVDINVSGEPDYLGAFNMTCRASLKPRITSQLSHYLVLDWVRVDGEDIQQLDGVSIGEQQFSTDHETTTRNLVFDPLIMAHGGDYRCEAKLILPDNAGSFNTTLDYHLNVLGKGFYLTLPHYPCFIHHQIYIIYPLL